VTSSKRSTLSCQFLSVWNDHEGTAQDRGHRRSSRPQGGAGKRWPAIQAELVRRRLDVRFGVMPKLYSGAHVYHSKVRTSRGTSFRFVSEVETLVDLDGEAVGRLPLDVSVLPRAFLIGTVS
jgi:YegS C-terminal NAD kinase beta sandwich-like domain